jgi:Rrf2 family protein
MLRLSKKTDYALISLSYVAAQGNRPASAREIAERHDIPVELLAKVLQRLVQRGVLRSLQGIHGGYLLARPAETVTVAEVVEAIDGPLQLTVCGTTDERCEQFAKCSIRDPLHRIRDRIIGALMACTVAELLSDRHDEPVAMPFATGGMAVAGRRPAVPGSVKDL